MKIYYFHYKRWESVALLSYLCAVEIVNHTFTHKIKRTY